MMKISNLTLWMKMSKKSEYYFAEYCVPKSEFGVVALVIVVKIVLMILVVMVLIMVVFLVKTKYGYHLLSFLMRHK